MRNEKFRLETEPAKDETGNADKNVQHCRDSYKTCDDDLKKYQPTEQLVHEGTKRLCKNDTTPIR